MAPPGVVWCGDTDQTFIQWVWRPQPSSFTKQEAQMYLWLLLFHPSHVQILYPVPMWTFPPTSVVPHLDYWNSFLTGFPTSFLTLLSKMPILWYPNLLLSFTPIPNTILKNSLCSEDREHRFDHGPSPWYLSPAHLSRIILCPLLFQLHHFVQVLETCCSLCLGFPSPVSLLR